MDSFVHPGPLAPSSSYSEAVEFSQPVYMDHYTIVVPLKAKKELWSFLYPFSYEVWIILLSAIPIFILAMGITNYADIQWGRIAGFVLRVAMVDGRFSFKVINSKGNAYQRALAIIWIWAFLILVHAYDGNLIAMITTPKVEKLVQNTADLTNQNDIDVVIDPLLPEVHEYMNSSSVGSTMRKLYDITEVGHTEKDEWFSACYTVKLLHAGTYASICDSKSVQDLKSQNFSDIGTCNFYTTDDTFFMSPAVMAFQVTHKIMN